LRIQGIPAVGPIQGNGVDAVSFLDFQGCVMDGHGSRMLLTAFIAAGPTCTVKML
jgi:hypothetical protein